MSDERGRNDWMAAARADLARRAPDPMIETQLLARVRERHALLSVQAATLSPRPKPRAGAGRVRAAWWMRLAIGVPVAVAAVLVALVGANLLAPRPGERPSTDVATPFIALVGSEALAAEREPIVVPSQVARTTLADYGLPVDPARADEPVGADFLVSRAGLVLAVRFRE